MAAINHILCMNEIKCLTRSIFNFLILRFFVVAAKSSTFLHTNLKWYRIYTVIFKIRLKIVLQRDKHLRKWVWLQRLVTSIHYNTSEYVYTFLKSDCDCCILQFHHKMYCWRFWYSVSFSCQSKNS